MYIHAQIFNSSFLKKSTFKQLINCGQNQVQVRRLGVHITGVCFNAMPILKYCCWVEDMAQ